MLIFFFLMKYHVYYFCLIKYYYLLSIKDFYLVPTSVYNITNSYENGVTSLSWAVPLSTGTSNIIYHVWCDGVTEATVNKTSVSVDLSLIQANLNCCVCCFLVK